MSTEIIWGLYVGGIADAREFFPGSDRVVICVLNQWPWNGDPAAIWLPVVVADADNLSKPIQALIGNLSLVADVAEAGLARGAKVLIHCRDGIERAPLAVAWFLAQKRGRTFDAAYAHLREMRPRVVDRRNWLP